MSKKVSYNEIQDSTVDWGLDEVTGLPYSGQSVQNYLRKHTQMAVDNKNDKIEAVAWDATTMSHLYFDSFKKYEEWLESGDNALAKQAVPLVIAGEQRRIRIATISGESIFYFTTENETAEVSVSVQLQSKDIADTQWEDVAEDTYMTVSIDRGNSGSWVDIISNQRVESGANFTADVRSYLAGGTNRVRFTAVDESGENNTSLIVYANLTSMYLRDANFAWYVPFIEGQPFSLGGLYIGGNLSKKLKIRVTDEDYYVADYIVNIGAATYINVAYYFTEMAFPTSGTGVYGVEMWLDADGLESRHLKYNIMCVSAEDMKTAQLVAISNVPSVVTNYDTNTLFSYACYNCGLSEATPSILVQSIINNLPASLVSETLTVATGIPHDYVQTLEIETSETNLNLSAVMTYGNDQEAYYAIDNTLSFPAISDGLSIYVNPTNRSNAQENKQYIINEFNGEQTLATWNNVAFINNMDGWTTDNEGRKCLRIPAYCSVDIPYMPLLNATKERTLEFAYKVTNAADFSEDIITIASSAASDFIGVKIKPTNVLVHSKLLYASDVSQSYNTKDEAYVHVLITLVQNYKRIANLAQIYVNGIKACSFEWSSGDDFNTPATIHIGSNSADIFLYKLRVYDRGFEWPAVIQNYISCLPDAESKRAAYNKINAVIFDNNIDYDKVVNSGLNYFVVRLPEGTHLPDAQHKSAVSGCRLHIDIRQNPEFVINGVYEDVKTEGQGTTSMNYFRWNLRWKTDAIRITAKKNYASPMHSHKMGATALFNDLNKIVVGANEADGRVAVEQYPAYGFVEQLIEGTADQYTYTPIGLYTIGQDKGDKATFGFNNTEYKDTLIHLEGTDHNPKAVGMDYPWSMLSVVTNTEGDANLGVLKNDGSVAAAWEVGACGTAESDAEMLAYLAQEFKPAYECDYFNTSMLVGLSGATIDDVNANLSVFRALDAGNGFTCGDCLIWFDGEYNTYYYDVVAERYLPDGVNLLTNLGIEESALTGTTVESKNAEICEMRKARYRAEMENYWHLRDNLFHYCFIVLFAATDNFKKNTYPYKFGTLEGGSRWRWRQDDLDTLFDINNQGLANKVYSLLNGDKSGTTHLFRGNASYHWVNIQQYYDIEIKNMMNEIMTAMAGLCPSGYGDSLIEKCVGCIRHYFWDKAQGYFPASAYNLDAEWSHEDAWAAMLNDQYDAPVHPLKQLLGGHYEAERAWVELRFLFMASMYGFGAFGAGNDQDSSTGQISFRPAQGENVFTLTPVINLNPTILVGDSDRKSAEGRVMAGDSTSISVSTDGDTSIYIQGVDYLSDIGDFSKVNLYAENPSLAVRGKRLKTLKVGGEVEGNQELSALDIGLCPSLTDVDARNTPNLTGSVSLEKCPRLQRALFGGSSASEIKLPDGCKITEFQLPDTLKNLSLVGLPNLSEEGLSYNTLNALTYLRVEGNSNLDGFAIMKVALTGETTALKNIRIIGFDYYGDASDIDLLSIFAEGGFYGIDADGNADNTIIPFLEGTLHVNGSVYEDTANIVADLYAGRITLDIQGGYYMRFADPEVLSVLMAKGVGDGIGVTVADAEAVTSIGTWFNGNSTIESFDEFEKFNKVTTLSGNWSTGAFQNCSSLKSISLPNSILTIGTCAFNKCSAMTSITLPDSITSVGASAFYGCTSLVIDGLYLPNLKSITNENAFKNVPIQGVVNLPSLTSLGYSAFYGTQIEEIANIGSVTSLGAAPNEGHGTFMNCSKLKKATLPSTLTTINNYAFRGCSSLNEINLHQAITTVGFQAFYNCTSLEIPDLSLPNLTSLGQNAFYGVKITKISDLGKITALPTATSSTQNFGNKSTLTEVVLPDTLTSIASYSFAGYSALTKCHIPDGVTTIGGYTFNGCTNLVDITLPTSITTIGDRQAFYNCSSADFGKDLYLPNLTTINFGAFAYTLIERVLDLGSVTTLGAYYTTGSWGTFGPCKKLTFVCLPETLTSISRRVFCGSTSLEVIVCKSTTPPTLDAEAFSGTNSTFVFYVPAASVPSYREATNWATYANRIGPLEDYEDGGWVKFADPAVEAICVANWDTNGSGFMSKNEVEAVTSIGTWFRTNTEITSFDELRYFTGVTSLGTSTPSPAQSPFYQCTNLQSIAIPSSVTMIGCFAFQGCTSLSAIAFEDASSITVLYDAAFRDSGMSGVVSFPNLTTLRGQCFVGTQITRVENLGKITSMPGSNSGYNQSSFDNCPNLTYVEIPDTVTSIGGFFIGRTPALTTVVFRATTPPTLSSAAWAGATIANVTIYVPDSSVDAYKAATNWATYAAQIKPLSEYNG